MRLTILGKPRTKKNSIRMLKNRSTGKMFPAQSLQHNDWARSAILQLKSQWRKPAIEQPVNVVALVYADRLGGDLLNFLAAVSDALEHAGVVANDRLCVSWDGSRLRKDAARPRVEIEIEVLAQTGAA